MAHLSYKQFAQTEYENKMDFIRMSRIGVDAHFLHDLVEILGVSIQEFAAILGISSKTIERREDDSKQFKQEISERLLHIGEVTKEGLKIWNTEELQGWMRSPNQALGNEKPINLLDTEYGIAMIAEVLGRIQYGIYS
jgi:putative toxin-antitoxin system antitoxin component (TIGR02293 family)